MVVAKTSVSQHRVLAIGCMRSKSSEVLAEAITVRDYYQFVQHGLTLQFNQRRVHLPLRKLFNLVLRHRCGENYIIMLLGMIVAMPVYADDLKVVASIKPVHSLVSAIMEGVGEPHLIMKGMADPHGFTPRPSDAAALSNAQIVFMVDEHMETSVVAMIEALNVDANVVFLTDSEGLIKRPLREGGAFEVDHAHTHGAESGGHSHGSESASSSEPDHAHSDSHNHSHGDSHTHSHDGPHDHTHGDVHGGDVHEVAEGEPFDLHIWLDPFNGAILAGHIAAVLSEADPENAETYQNNQQSLYSRLDQLTYDIDQLLTSSRNQPFLVFHDGYRYFEDRFGLNVVGSIVVTPERTPGAKRLRELQEKVRELEVVCVFDEPQFDTRIINVITEGSEVKSGTVDPLGASLEDGPGLYVSMLENLAETFSACLAHESHDHGH